MRKLNLFTYTIFLLVATILMVGGVSFGRTYNVLAKIDDSANIDLGKYNTQLTQENTETYSSLTTKNLYYDDSSATKAIYTVRISNLADIDVGSSTGYSSEFGNSIKIQMLASSDSSKRLPWLSHSFRLSDNLHQASINGYLNVSVNVNSKINTTKDELKSILYNGTLTSVADINATSYDIESIYKSTTAVDQTLTISNGKSSEYLLVFAMNRIDGGVLSWRTINMTVNKPTLSITSSDNTAPKVSFDIDNNWSSSCKVLTIKVTDSESGVLSATSDNELTLISESENDKEKVYSMNITDNGDYTVTVTDNVGNSYTYIYTESKFDKVKPNTISLSSPSVSYVDYIDINASLVSDNKSQETMYYTLDGSIPTIESNKLIYGTNRINVGYGKHLLTALAIDAVGNVGEISTCEFMIDRRKIDISLVKCDVNVTKPTTFDSDIGYQAYDNETIRLDFVANDNCERKVIRINGEEFLLVNDYFEFIITQDTKIEVIYVTQLMLIGCTTTYTYDPYITEVSPEFKLNIHNLELEVSITQGDLEVTPKNVGEYTVNWRYSDYDYAGSGKFQFEILPMDIYINACEDQYKIYGDSDVSEFSYEVIGLPDYEDIEVTLSRIPGENVGAYEIILDSVSLSNNFKVNYESQNYLIRARKLVVLADSLSKQFEMDDPELTYSFYESSLVAGDKLEGALSRTAGESVGTYTINKGTLSNSNYDILFLSGVLTITPRDIVISIDDIVTTYGEDKELTFTAEDGVNMLSFEGSLSRTVGNSIGIYNITIGTLRSDDYNISLLKNGTYTIKPKVITVRALPCEKVYGEKDNLNYQVDGLVYGDILVGKLSRNAGENVGQYEISLGTLAGDNYIINFESNYLTITPADLIVNIASHTQVYGEMELDLDYSIDGLKFDDELIIETYRFAGNDAGEYIISCKDTTNPNYHIAQVNEGVYTITKATIIPTIKVAKFVYSGNINYITSSDFPFELSYIYKLNGIECDGMLNAGNYQVQAIFDGNNNYNSSKSSIVTVTVEKQQVYITLSENKFIYDGTIKFPEFYYDMTCGLDINKLSFEFENDARPIEWGEYFFRIINTDENYLVDSCGYLFISKPLNIKNDNDSIIECEDATFDENTQDIVLVEEKAEGKFNDQKILSTCKFENITQDDDHIYTVKLKAISDAKNVYVYQLGENNSVREIVVNNIDGYYVFKVDNLTDTYIITTDVEPISIWFWLALVAGVIVILFIILQIVKHRKKEKVSSSKNSSFDTFNIN